MAKRRSVKRSSTRSTRKPSRSAKQVKDMSGTIFVGFLFLGLLGGALYNNWAAGALAGLGMGFIASVYVKMKY